MTGLISLGVDMVDSKGLSTTSERKVDNSSLYRSISSIIEPHSLAAIWAATAFMDIDRPAEWKPAISLK